jgi:hypothetical protein
VSTTGEGEYKKPVFRITYESLSKYFKNVGYKPHPHQKKFHKSLSRVRVVTAGSRGGKSRGAGEEAAPHMFIPNFKICIVAKTYNLASKEFSYVHKSLLQHPNDRIRKALGDLLKSAANNKATGQMWIEFGPPLNSHIECKSIQDPDSLLGDEYDMMILGEGSKIPKNIWDDYLEQRLASRQGQLIIPTTPDGVDDLIHPFYELGQEKEMHYGKRKNNYIESVESWNFPSYANPAYPRAQYEAALRKVEIGTLDRETLDEQYGGKFVTRSGKIFKVFNKEIHVVEPYEIPMGWTAVRGIDVGGDAPTVALIVRIDPDGNLVVTHEYYESGLSVPANANGMRESAVDRHGIPIKIAYSVIDPAASQRTASNIEDAMMQYIEAGIPCMKANNSVDAGLDRVREYLDYELDDENRIVTPPKLFIFNTCEKLIKEFDKYIYSKLKDGTKTNQPVKRNDHGLDALRYICMERPSPVLKKQVEYVEPNSLHDMYRSMMRRRRRMPRLGA